MAQLVGYLLLFVVVGIGFIFVHLVAGKLLRPAKPDAEKLTIYECGEPTIGSAWIQFDLRFYVVALLFVIFDVEVAFFFPWAVVFGKANALANPRLEAAAQAAPDSGAAAARLQLTDGLVPAGRNPGRLSVPASAAAELGRIALLDLLVFFGVLLFGFAYLWRRGDLDWVRSVAAERAVPSETRALAGSEQELIGAGSF